MAIHVCNGATLQCTFGVAPSMFVVPPQNRVTTSSQPAANIMDHKPFINILPFGMCSAPTNPAFIAATALAAGVPTPVPCTPVTLAPWVPGAPTVSLAYMPSLNNTSKLMCAWCGFISVTVPGQVTEYIP